MNSRQERAVDSGSDGDHANKPAYHTDEQRAVWEAGGLEAVLGEEPKSRGVGGALWRAGPESRAECVVYEGPGQSRAFLSRGGGDGDSTGAPVCLYGMGGGAQGPPGPPEPLPSADDPAACLSALGPLDWKAEPVLIPSKMCLLAPQLSARESSQSGSDTYEGSGCGPSDGAYGPLQGGGGPQGRGGSREKRFFCSFCGKGFSFPKQVEIHQRVHTGEKPFSCTQCRQRFSHSGNLKRHQRVHTGEKPFSCTQCEKRFSHLHQLKMHQRIHSGERPFACAHCGRRFSERSYLRIHQQRSHAGAYAVR